MSAGKGDTYRQVDRKAFDTNYENVFGPKCVICHEPCSIGHEYHPECWYRHNIIDLVNYIKQIMSESLDESQLRNSLNQLITHVTEEML